MLLLLSERPSTQMKEGKHGNEAKISARYDAQHTFVWIGAWAAQEAHPAISDHFWHETQFLIRKYLFRSVNDDKSKIRVFFRSAGGFYHIW